MKLRARRAKRRRRVSHRVCRRRVFAFLLRSERQRTAEGQPRVLFTLFGVLMLGVLGKGLTQLDVDSYVREIITGSIIIVAVAAGSLGRARQG